MSGVAYRLALQRKHRRKEARRKRLAEGRKAARAVDREETESGAASARFYKAVFKRAREEDGEASAREERAARPRTLVEISRRTKERVKQERKVREEERRKGHDEAEAKRRKRAATSKAIRARTRRGQPRLGALSTALLERVIKMKREEAGEAKEGGGE